MIEPREIFKLFSKELADANTKHPLFSSEHEAFAVLFEEVEETQREWKSVEERTEALWDMVKQEEDIDCIKKMVEDILMDTLTTIQEAVQVGAMCKKFVDLLDKEKEKYE